MARVVRTQKVRQLYLFRDHLYLALTPTALTLTIPLSCVRREERDEEIESMAHSTAQYITAQHSTAQHRMVLYNTVLSSITQQITLQHCTTQER